MALFVDFSWTFFLFFNTQIEFTIGSFEKKGTEKLFSRLVLHAVHKNTIFKVSMKIPSIQEKTSLNAGPSQQNYYANHPNFETVRHQLHILFASRSSYPSRPLTRGWKHLEQIYCLLSAHTEANMHTHNSALPLLSDSADRWNIFINYTYTHDKFLCLNCWNFYWPATNNPLKFLTASLLKVLKCYCHAMRRFHCNSYSRIDRICNLMLLMIN